MAVSQKLFQSIPLHFRTAAANEGAQWQCKFLQLLTKVEQ